MSKAAFVILAAGDTHESLGRDVNAFMGALEYAKENAQVKISSTAPAPRPQPSLQSPITSITTYSRRCACKSKARAATALVRSK